MYPYVYNYFFICMEQPIQDKTINVDQLFEKSNVDGIVSKHKLECRWHCGNVSQGKLECGRHFVSTQTRCGATPILWRISMTRACRCHPRLQGYVTRIRHTNTRPLDPTSGGARMTSRAWPSSCPGHCG